jgi:hypothetical protein
MFGENPSVGRAYMPFGVYEAIDPGLILFLDGWVAELPGRPGGAVPFSGEGASGLEAEGDLLVMLNGEHLKGMRAVYRGRVGQRPERALAYRLDGLIHRMRIRRQDAARAFRYFTDNVYDAEEMRSDYILIRKAADFVDILVPSGEAAE